MSDTKNMPGQDAWKKLVEEQAGRFEKAQEEMARFEQIGLEQARTAVDEMAKIQKESFAYVAQLSSEWRKMALEAMKAQSSMFTRGIE